MALETFLNFRSLSTSQTDDGFQVFTETSNLLRDRTENAADKELDS